LDNTQTLYVNLVQVAQNVSNSLPPPPSNSSASIFTSFGINLALNVGTDLPDVGLYVALLQAGFEIMGNLNNSPSGSPKKQIKTTTAQLAEQTADAVASAVSQYGLLRELMLSDYGKLSTMARTFIAGDWGAIDDDTIDAAVAQLNYGYTQSFYGSLMPVSWPVYRLLVAYNPAGNTLADNPPTILSANAYHCWDGAIYVTPYANAAATGQFVRTVGFYGDGYAIGQPQNEAWVWAKSPFDISQNVVPKATFTDPLFESVEDGGVGLVSPIFWEQNFKPFGNVTCANQQVSDQKNE
jgi:hypothetical protein